MGRVMLSGQWVQFAEAAGLLDRSYTRDSDGKFSSGSGGDGDAASLTMADFAEGTTWRPGRAGAPEIQIREQLQENAARKVADRWDVSPADLEETIREGGHWGNYKDKPFDEQKTAFIEARIAEWRSGPGHPIGVMMIHGAASGRGVELSESEQRVVGFAAAHPGIERATASLGRAMYAETQSWFAERGITAVKAQRATMNPDGESRNLATSWSLQGSSGWFQRTREHTVVDADIPVSQIFSIPPTGLGSYEEAELIVMPPVKGA